MAGPPTGSARTSNSCKVTKACPQGLTKLGSIDGIGKAKLAKHGQRSLALLAWLNGATTARAEPVRHSGTASGCFQTRGRSARRAGSLADRKP